jgi:hypothetical protein
MWTVSGAMFYLLSVRLRELKRLFSFFPLTPPPKDDDVYFLTLLPLLFSFSSSTLFSFFPLFAFPPPLEAIAQPVRQWNPALITLFLLGRRKTGFDRPDIWHSLIPVCQLPESLLAKNILYKQLVDPGVKTLPK